MEIKKVKLKDLKLSPFNPRRIAENNRFGLKNSLDKFGLVEPLVVNKRNNHIVGGNQRFEILKEKGIEELEVSFVDLNDMEEKALCIALNNPGLQGIYTHDVTNLINELKNNRPDLFDLLRMFEVKPDVIEEYEKDLKVKEKLDSVYQEIAIRPFEHYDYVFILAKDIWEWNFLHEFFKLEKVDVSMIPGQKKIGLGRGVPASKFMELVEKLTGKKVEKPKEVKADGSERHKKRN